MNSYGLTGGSVAVLPDALPAKQAMRERIRAERRLREPWQREADARGLTAVALEQPEITAARCVAVYASTATAPGTLLLRKALRAGGTCVLLPVLLDNGQVDWAVDAGSAAQGPNRRPRGVRLGAGRRRSSPLGRDDMGQADVVIVPALAVDTLGNRLGQGAGFYERALRTIDPTVTVFALTYESEVLDAAIEPVPAEAHDRPVDAVITPQRCLRLPPRRR